MTIRGVIFDMGGTLAPPSAFMEAKVAGLLEWAQTKGLSRSAETPEVVASAHRWLWEETFATGRQYTTPEAMARAAQQLGWPLDDAFLNEASRVFHLPEAARRPYADAIPSLEFLKRKGLRLAVISDHSDQWLVEYILTHAGLRLFFDPVVSSATFGRIKPDPGIFRIVLNSWRCSARECIMVGDTLEADIAGGRAVGMRTILVTMDPSPRNARLRTPVHPDATAASLSDVVTIIRTWIE